MTSPAADRSLATSPSLSSSSFDMLSSSFSALSERALRDLDDEDQIVWSIAGSTGLAPSTDSSENDSDVDSDSVDSSTGEEGSLAIRSNASPSVASDDDYVILSPRLGLGAVAPVSDLVSRISRMALNSPAISCTSYTPVLTRDEQIEARDARWRRRQLLNPPVTTSKPSAPKKRTPKAKKVKSVPIAPQRTATVTPLRLALPAAAASAPASELKPKPTTKKKAKVAKKAKAAKKSKHAAPVPVLAAPSVVESPSGLGERPLVKDDVSEFGDASAYEEASSYISTFLLDKGAQEQTPRLSLLHALIIELDLLPASTSALPPSLTKARALLRSKAFLNIREYIATRERGPSALQAIMHPTRRALVKSIREKRNPASLRWVKENGLQVLLVHCF